MSELISEDLYTAIKLRDAETMQTYTTELTHSEFDRNALIKEVDRLRAELTNTRNAVLDEALGEVVDVQMSDSNRFVEEGRSQAGSCGSYCGYGETCHGAEAYAALNRLGSKLIALKNREEVPAGRP